MTMANATIVPGNCVTYCKILPEQTYAWVTFRSVEEVRLLPPTSTLLSTANTSPNSSFQMHEY